MIENILKKSERRIGRIIARLTSRFGFQCKIHFPVTDDSPYRSESSSANYDEEPSVQDKFLVTGLLKETSNNLQTIDPFFEDDDNVLYSTNPEIVIPKNSMVIVMIWDKEIYFKVDSIRHLLGEHEGSTYVKHILVPMG